MRRYLLTFLSLVLFLGQSLCLSAQTQTKESKLLMTIGCMTDLHCEYDMIQSSTSVEDVRLRETVVATLNKIKEEENLDLILLGGDYTSQVTSTYENWERSRELLVEATRDVFAEGKSTPVLYCAGNHEYDAPNYNGLPKGWNSADYYSFPMKEDVGVLSLDDCLYEDADNGSKGTMSLLAAYHYNIKGIDFVVLNTGKYLFKSNGNYYYSDESAQWCVNKIDELYEKNPNGTVFFIMHIPFGDSNSISESSKGQWYGNWNGKYTSDASNILKKGLAKHPNTIVLYGHDHGGDKAYIKEKTSQRVTRYDKEGNYMSSITDVNHVDGTARPEGSEPIITTSTVTCLKNLGNNKYLGCDATDINMFDEPQAWEVVSRGSNLFGAHITYNGTAYNLSCGDNGYYSVKTRTTSTNGQENGYWYEVTDVDAATVTGTRVSSVELGHNYIIVQNYHGNYAVGNSLTSDPDKQRIDSYLLGTASESSAITDLGSTITLDNTDGAAKKYIYKYDQEDVQEITYPSSAVLEPSDASFVTLFMGSMRYYNNKVEGPWIQSAYTRPAKIIQALMIYVYEDRIEMQMKNYGKTGEIESVYYTNTSVTIAAEPTPYTIFRNVVRTTDVNPVEPGPISDVFYKVTSDGEWLPAEIENRSLTINDATWKGINTENESDFDLINYERLYKSSAWQGFNVPFEFTVTADHLKTFNFAKIQGAIAEENGTTSIAYVPLKAGDVVKANTPYVIKARKANSKTPQTLVAQNATMKVPVESGFTVQSATDIYEFNGIYNDKVAEKDAKWYALNSSGTYQHMSKGVVLQPFRIFMDITPRDDNPYAVKSAPSTNQNAKVYYKTSVNGTWQEAQISNNTITIDDVNWKGIKADGNRLFSTINYSRLFKSTEWQAWYVPFDLTLDNQILKNFSFAKIQGTLAEEDGTPIIAYVRLKVGDVLNANTPYVVKAKRADSTTPQVISVSNAILQVPVNNNGFTLSSASDEYGYYGVSEAKVSTMTDRDLWYAINLKGSYQHMAAGVTLQPFRIYMTMNSRSDNPYELTVPQEEIKIRVFGDEFEEADPTAINAINVDAQQQTGKWYNIQGMEVNAPTKGVYIKDGKKYLF